jgi:hypothetical protein
VRFLWAILPLFGFLFAMGAQRALRQRPASPRHSVLRVASGAVVVLLVIGYGWYNVGATWKGPWLSGSRSTAEDAAPMVRWARENTRPGDLLATDNDPLIHLYTGRRTIPVGTFTPEEYLVPQSYEFATAQLAVLVRDYRPRWVMCSSSYCVIAARNLSQRNPPVLRFLGALERGAVFEPVAP